MPCHAMHPIQDLFLESFSDELQFDMHFYIHSDLRKSFYSCKKWVSNQAFKDLDPPELSRYRVPPDTRVCLKSRHAKCSLVTRLMT
jgi:hypothetical protein